MPNNLEDLRNHLFETIRALKDEKNPMDVERAKAVADVSRVILDSAKVEIGYMRATGADQESDFISNPNRKRLPGHKAPPPPQPSIAPGRPEADSNEKATPTDGRIACLNCNEKFPDAKSLGIHRTRVHFTDEPAMARRAGQ